MWVLGIGQWQTKVGSRKRKETARKEGGGGSDGEERGKEEERGEKKIEALRPRRRTDARTDERAAINFCHPVVRAGPKRLQLWF